MDDWREYEEMEWEDLPMPEEPKAWHRIEIETDPYQELVVIHESTNDNLDRGYPNEFARWDSEMPNLQAALRYTGYSRIGISGIEVEVFVDGVQVWSEDDLPNKCPPWRLAEARKLWEMLGNVPLDPEGYYLDHAFLHFKKGTPKEDVWHWFEETYNISVTALMYPQQEG